MTNDSCRQCTKRRIKCDKGSPRCAKCIKKGLECSGVGRQIRFVTGVASRGKLKGLSVPVATNLGPISPARPKQTSNLLNLESIQEDQEHGDASPRNAVSDCTDLVLWTEFEQRSDTPAFFEGPMTLDIPLCPTIEILNPGIRMLFDHFAKVIARYMVVLDSGTNGYRDFILPLACNDTLVQRAVSAVSALHLSSQRPELRVPAEAGRAAVITRLRQDALSNDIGKVSTSSTWATLLVLLVGETVTGSMDFVHLFKMLKFIVDKRSAGEQEDVLSSFLLKQSRMFQLFTPPLLDAEEAQELSRKQPDYYFDFLSFPPSVESQHYGTLFVLKEAIRQACDLYFAPNSEYMEIQSTFERIERLKYLVQPITADTPGAHALVWVYFIAAAESRAKAHQLFFSQRLSELYEVGKFGNIPVAMQTLKRIWNLEHGQRWTEHFSSIERVLIV